MINRGRNGATMTIEKLRGAEGESLANVQSMKKVLGRSLHDARLEMRVHVRDLATALGITTTALREAESGEEGTTIDLLITALLTLGLPPADIARMILEAE